MFLSVKLGRLSESEPSAAACQGRDESCLPVKAFNPLLAGFLMSLGCEAR